MKKASLLILTIILVACAAPVAEVPTAIPSATATQVPLPTATLTPQPTATLIESTPTSEVKEKIYTSCVDSKLISQLDDNFETRTGIDLDNLDISDAGKKFQEGLNSVQFIGFSPDKDIVTFSLIKTGVDIVPVDVAGSNIEELVCVYGRTGLSSLAGQTVSVVVGWVDKSGEFQPMSPGVSDQLRKNFSFDEILGFFQGLPDGAIMTFPVHTFNGITNPDQINIESNTELFPEQTKYVIQLLKALNNQLLDRAPDRQDPGAYWAVMNPELQDPGFIVAGQWNYFSLLDLK